jgi:phosphomannomutase
LPSDATLAQAADWLRHDPDPQTRDELAALIEAESPELEERFAGPLAFGTAGLRGILGAGETRMNRAVIRRTTLGLARYLLEHVADAGERGVVVGHDARRMSRELAEDTARVLCAAGLPAHLSESICPTPLCAYGVRHFDAVAGVMVTASHNPPEYNGYKVYAANGAQIIPPADRLIAEAIAACPPPDEIPLMPLDEAKRDGLLRVWGADLERSYLDEIASLAPSVRGDRSLPIAYTPLHGVGERLLRQAFTEAGFSQVHTVPEQAAPDGAFPTVDFPNPEEAGALDLALDLARRIDAELIIANDPDADRLAVAVRSGPGQYRQLSGNDVGALLGHHALTDGAGAPQDRLVITTIVSSPWLSAIAEKLGARYAETLTGFKWIANRGMELERTTGARFAFGYEEALGYTVGSVVWDKDGISAALVVACLAAALRAEGSSLLDRLDDIATEFGLYLSAGRSVVLPGADGKARIEQIMADLRAAPPTELGGRRVTAVLDCQTGEQRRGSAPPEPLELPRSNVLVLQLEGGDRVVARPSGTEPKLKLYVDVREPVPERSALAAARERAAARLDELRQALLAAAGLDG